MSPAFEAILTELEGSLPAICARRDLAKTGFFTHASLCRGRTDGTAPPCIAIRGKHHYLRGDILEFLRKSYQGAANGTH